MKANGKNTFFLIGISLFLCSCATSYKAINPASVRYSNIQVADSSVVLQYKYDILTISGNRKYAKKEAKFKTNMLAVKITNNTDSIINTSQLMFSSGDRFIVPLLPRQTKKMLKQKGAYHLFYLLLSPMQLYSGSTSTPIGLFIGPGLALLNIGIAAAANKEFENNLKEFSIQNKDISPKQSIYGLVGFVNSKGEPIYAKIKPKGMK